MKMLFFDFRESESDFFKNNEFPDIDIKLMSEPLTEDTVLSEDEYNNTDVISVFINSQITKKVLDKFKNLRVILTRSTGYNHIDIINCAHKNISVFNVENYGKTSVTQYTIGTIITLVRKILPAYLDMQKGEITHSLYEGKDLNSLTLGIIGCGAIGSAVAQTASFLGMKILAHSYMKPQELTNIVDFVSLDELLANSDVISLHIPYSTENYHMIGNSEFNKMKEGVYLINTSRGELIDVVALYENLLSGKVQGAALDVLECEYLSFNGNIVTDIKNCNEKCVTSALITKKLLEMNNVIITPHIAYNTTESVNTLLETSFNNIRDYNKGMHTNQVW